MRVNLIFCFLLSILVSSIAFALTKSDDSRSLSPPRKVITCGALIGSLSRYAHNPAQQADSKDPREVFLDYHDFFVSNFGQNQRKTNFENLFVTDKSFGFSKDVAAGRIAGLEHSWNSSSVEELGRDQVLFGIRLKGVASIKQFYSDLRDLEAAYATGGNLFRYANFNRRYGYLSVVALGGLATKLNPNAAHIGTTLFVLAGASLAAALGDWVYVEYQSRDTLRRKDETIEAMAQNKTPSLNQWALLSKTTPLSPHFIEYIWTNPKSGVYQIPQEVEWQSGLFGRHPETADFDQLLRFQMDEDQKIVPVLSVFMRLNLSRTPAPAAQKEKAGDQIFGADPMWLPIPEKSGSLNLR